MTEQQWDSTKWNASCDLLHEMIVRVPNAEMRGVIRDQLMLNTN